MSESVQLASADVCRCVLTCRCVHVCVDVCRCVLTCAGMCMCVCRHAQMTVDMCVPLQQQSSRASPPLRLHPSALGLGTSCHSHRHCPSGALGRLVPSARVPSGPRSTLPITTPLCLLPPLLEHTAASLEGEGCSEGLKLWLMDTRDPTQHPGAQVHHPGGLGWTAGRVSWGVDTPVLG